jgi:hypothetical protein
MAQGPLKKDTALSGPPPAKEDDFKILPQKDSKVTRTGHESYGGKTQKG